ncbi:MAG: aldehyde ferredoxin oxidoreductase C-terminal domain-containing protein, partial [Bacillota bacterium]|nr:aldehyde ferredoxin oxidoreductase C-terminal domain-containing protein [Bacillota bacterium]
FTQVFDRFGTAGKGELVARMQDLMGLYDSLKICKLSLLGGVTPSLALEWLNLATGWEMGLEEFLLAGERIFTLKRLFNLGCGVTRRDDTLPERILRLPRREGGAGDNLPPLEVMLEDYYRVRGWDAEGRPTPERLRALGLA